jgi:predicted nucleotidyltransferase
MGVSASKEPDRDRARRIAEDGCVLRALVGSSVHGLSNPGTDDRDEMGVCIEPPEYVIGLREFEHFIYRTQAEGQPSGPGDLDLTIYGLRKWCRLALRGSPTVLLLLFVRGGDVLQRTPIGQELQRLAPAFVSRRTGESFLGYCVRSVLRSRMSVLARVSRAQLMATTPSTRCTRCGSPIRAASC